MMKLESLFLLCLLCVGSYACKQEATTHEVESAADTSKPNAAPRSEENPNLVSNMSWTFLTDQLFRHDATVKSGTPDPDYNKGHWIDFHDNGSYDYGIWREKSYDGKWTYTDTTRTLRMIPNGSQKPSEWEVMHKDRKLVLIGTHTYGDNALQEQWIRYEQRPDKNAKPEEYEGD